MIAIPKDEMTPKERMDAFGRGEEIDRVPCCPFTGESYATYFGYSLDDYNHSTEIIVYTIIRTFQMFRADNCSIGPGLQGIPEAMGARLHFSKNDIPQIAAPAISSYEEISKLKPINPYKDGRLKLYLEALKIVQDKLGNEVNIGNTVGGPFTTTAFLIGTEKFLRDLRRNPDKIKEVLEIATLSTLNVMDAIMDLGITPGIADPIASSTLINKSVYREFVFPTIKTCQDHIRKRMGGTGIMHICGKTKPVWEEIVSTGIAGFSLDNIEDIGEFRQGYEDKVLVIGNVDPVGVILNGTKEDIYEAVRVCCEKGMGSKNGYILASGCDIPIGTPPEKIMHFIDAARVYGRMK